MGIFHWVLGFEDLMAVGVAQEAFASDVISILGLD